MTIQEIRDLIAKKIAGQGTQVDVGGGLPTILNAICDAVDAAQAAAPKVVTSSVVCDDWDEEPETIEDAATILGISADEMSRIYEYDKISFTDMELSKVYLDKAGNGMVIFGGSDLAKSHGVTLTIVASEGYYYINGQHI